MATILSVSAQRFQTTDCAPFVCNLYLWQNVSRRIKMSEQIFIFNQQIQIKMLSVISIKTFAVKLRQSRNFERAAKKTLQFITPLLFYNHQGPHVVLLCTAEVQMYKPVCNHRAAHLSVTRPNMREIERGCCSVLSPPINTYVNLYKYLEDCHHVSQ